MSVTHIAYPFTAAGFARLAVYRAAVQAGFYTDQGVSDESQAAPDCPLQEMRPSGERPGVAPGVVCEMPEPGVTS